MVVLETVVSGVVVGVVVVVVRSSVVSVVVGDMGVGWTRQLVSSVVAFSICESLRKWIILLSGPRVTNMELRQPESQAEW